eukprot:6184365-Prymnesium_polylepis.1
METDAVGTSTLSTFGSPSASASMMRVTHCGRRGCAMWVKTVRTRACARDSRLQSLSYHVADDDSRRPRLPNARRHRSATKDIRHSVCTPQQVDRWCSSAPDSA